MSDKMRLSQAISAKICHDLSGAIGTIYNCLSLSYSDDSSISQKAKDLVELEAKNLVARLRFFRSAYGLSDGDSDISLIFLRKLFKDFFHNSDVKLQLECKQGMIFLEMAVAKATMSLASLVSDSIGAAGILEIYIGNDNNNCTEVNIKGSGSRAVQVKDENIGILTGNGKSLVGVHNCREHYIRNLYNKNGYELVIKIEDTSITCRLRKKKK